MRIGHFINLLPQQNFLKNVLYSRQYNDNNSYLLHNFLKENSVILDIGANIGLHTCAYAELYRKLKVTIHAIEALPSNFDLLNVNVNSNKFKNIYTYNIAVGDRPGHLNITVPSEDFVGNAVGDNIRGESLDGVKYNVKMNTLDEWSKEVGLTRCDFIKIDIEGAEYLAFKGGFEFITKTRPVILSEFNRHWIEKSGYNLAAFLKFFRELNYHIAIDNGSSFKFSTDEELISNDLGLFDLLMVPKERK